MPKIFAGSPRPRAAISRGRAAKAALAALGAAVLVCAGSLPATAAPQAQVDTEAVLDLVDATPAAGALVEVDMTVSGLPATTEAGAQFSVDFEVQNTVLGAPEPTGDVSLVTLNQGPTGFKLLGTEGLVDSRASIVVRPMGIATQYLAAVYEGDDTHQPVVTILDPVEVTPVFTSTLVEIDSDSPAYGGGELGVWVEVLTPCQDETFEEDVREMCEASYGNPHGEVTLLMDDKPVGTLAIEGSNRLGVPDWLDLDVDLSEPESSSIVLFEVPLPDRALGSPDQYTFSATFTPHNWFAASRSEAVDVAALPAETVSEVVLGSLDAPVHSVALGEFVDVAAFVRSEPSWGGPLEGTVNLWVNGDLAAEGLELEDEFSTAVAKLSFDEPGEYSLVAEYVPSSLNHNGSRSDAYSFTVEASAPDDGADGGKDADKDAGKNDNQNDNKNNSANGAAKGDTNKQKPAAQNTSLANTGADSSTGVASLGLLLLIGAGAVSVAALQRRRARAK